MIEQNPIAGEEPVGFSVVHGVPMSGAFRGRVRGSGVKWRGFRLGRRSGSEHLRGSGLVVPNVRSAGGHDVGSDGFEEAEGARGHHIGGVIRDLEGNGDVGLGSKVVDLVGGDGVDPAA